MMFAYCRQASVEWIVRRKSSQSPDIHAGRVPIRISAGTTAFRVPLITPIEASHLDSRTRVSHAGVCHAVK